MFDKLIFEGEYYKGKKNGKGKEYYSSNGNIYFEGDYLNGLKLKGKEYNDYGELIFEGLYMDGKRLKIKKIKFKILKIYIYI